MVDNKSAEMLEFPKLLGILTGFTSFSVSRSLAESLLPQDDPESVSLLLRQSTEARNLLSFEPNLSIGQPVDIRETVRMTSLGKVLEPALLLDVRSILLAASLMNSTIKEHSPDLPSLWDIARQIVVLPQLADEIERCIDPSGEVLDTSSAELAGIRHELSQTRLQITNRLEKILRAENNQPMIQDNFITERGGRYVIPIKTEFQGEMKGIIHDVSNTEATVFIEPMAIVELGNRLRQLAMEEEREVLRILTVLSEDVAEYSELIVSDVNLIAELDLALAKAKFAQSYSAREPQIASPDEATRIFRLAGARHPLLKEKAVPISVQIGDGFSGLVITGPNTGGKTVSLKTIGLFVLMAQAGIPIPASEESRIPVFDNIFADIGDEQSIEETLSSFSWHIGNITRIIEKATQNSLVLLDELGTSTDPAEGAALAQAIMSYFIENNTMVAATTHFGELKAFAHKTPGMENASMEFDPVTLAPTYRMVQGIPGGSNALSTAAHLGLPTQIIDRASQMLPKGMPEMESMVRELALEKETVRAERSAMESEREAATALKQQLEEDLQDLERHKQDILRDEREKIGSEAAELRKQIRRASSELKKSKSKQKIEEARSAIDTVHEQLESEVWQVPASSSGEALAVSGIEDISIGEAVRVIDTSIRGTVAGILEKTGEVEVHAGKTRLKVSAEDLEKIEKLGEKSYSRSHTLTRDETQHPRSLELDLRGKRADEVEPEVDAYLNDASIAGFHEVRIIHGYGTGTLRQIVRDMLASHPLIRSFRSGKQEEGGDGVTVIKL
ncbi:MAG: endonuclease MutS2 [Dehalococcoidia bacterium]